MQIPLSTYCVLLIATACALLAALPQVGRTEKNNAHCPVLCRGGLGSAERQMAAARRSHRIQPIAIKVYTMEVAVWVSRPNLVAHPLTPPNVYYCN
jgi:hypothetical protein